MKHILLINRELAPYKNDIIMGGAEFVVKQQLELLSKKYKVDFYTSKDSDHFCMNNVEIFKSTNESKYFYKNTLESRRAPNKFRKNFIKEIANLISTRKYDLIISHTYELYGPLALAPFANKVKCLHIEHGCKEARGGMGLFGYYDACKKFKENNGILLAVSDYAKNDLTEYIVKKFGWENQLFTDYLYPYFANEKWYNNKIEDYLCIISRIDPVKNVGLALEFLAKNQNIKAKFCTNHWVGNEDYDAYYGKMMAKYGDLDNVEWIVNADRDKVLDILSKARVFLHTSPNETFSIVTAEALNFGIPAILITKPHGNSAWSGIQGAYGNYLKTLPIISGSTKENVKNLEEAYKQQMDLSYNKSIKEIIHSNTCKIFNINNFYNKIEELMK